MAKEATISIYRYIALQFEEVNLSTHKFLALFENLYGVKGAEAVREHPRFKALLHTLEILLHDLDRTEAPNFDTIARSMVAVHERAGVSSMNFVVHADRIEDLVREEGRHPALLKNFRLLKYTVAKLHDEFIKKEASRKQAALLEALETLMEKTPVGFFLCDIETAVIYQANSAFLGMLGVTNEELIGRTWHEITPPEVVQKELEENEELLGGRVSMIRREKLFLKKGGDALPVILYFGKFFDPRAGKEVYIDFVADISELKKTQKKLEEAHRYFYEVFNQIGNMLVVIDPKGGILEVNQAAEALLGYSKEELLEPGFDEWRCVHPEDHEKILAHFIRLFETGQPQRLEMRAMHKDGSVIELLASYSLYRGLQNGPPQILGAHVDISAMKKLEAELRYLSFHDSLTGLFNRAYFEQELDRLSKGRTVPVAVGVMDVDNLKSINDTLGHQMGDALIIRTAEVLKKAFRAEDVIARMGGDEFAVLFLGPEEKTLKKILERIEEAVFKDNEAKGSPRLSLSVGFALVPHTPFQPEEVYKAADLAMYKEKISKKLAGGPF